ncbi:hypothetical protein HF864_07580 [Lactobacillus sp. MRS-253-APC-2B]|uniref:hypothetical protein n=1 Tax=Lactobacillus sp. MRS-253-APC-2B TaxID=2725305 RepID=UPI00146BE234|nr:hypothetical protein [Lactobacillus sp. MRS-253-APC-2B]NME34617.1 hypothetical protein [Lactobacillus sp. MRS-253-APC-2B]
MQKKIEYPVLVEQMHAYLISRGINNVSKLTLFNEMVKDGMINKNGQPTKKAIENGLIEAADYNDLNPIQQFKAYYPQFSAVPDKFFQVDEQNNVLIGFKGFAWYASRLINDENASIQELNATKQILALYKQRGLTDQSEQQANSLIESIDRLSSAK